MKGSSPIYTHPHKKKRLGTKKEALEIGGETKSMKEKEKGEKTYLKLKF